MRFCLPSECKFETVRKAVLIDQCSLLDHHTWNCLGPRALTERERLAGARVEPLVIRLLDKVLTIELSWQ